MCLATIGNDSHRRTTCIHVSNHTCNKILREEEETNSLTQYMSFAIPVRMALVLHRRQSCQGPARTFAIATFNCYPIALFLYAKLGCEKESNRCHCNEKITSHKLWRAFSQLDRSRCLHVLHANNHVASLSKSTASAHFCNAPQLFQKNINKEQSSRQNVATQYFQTYQFR